jgi:hypothetical protein
VSYIGLNISVKLSFNWTFRLLISYISIQHSSFLSNVQDFHSLIYSSVFVYSVQYMLGEFRILSSVLYISYMLYKFDSKCSLSMSYIFLWTLCTLLLVNSTQVKLISHLIFQSSVTYIFITSALIHLTCFDSIESSSEAYCYDKETLFEDMQFKLGNMLTMWLLQLI